MKNKRFKVMKWAYQAGFSLPILLLALGGALLLVAGSALYLYQGGSAGPVAQVPPAPKAPGDSAQQQSDTRFYGADPVDSLARSNANIQGLSETQVRDLIRQALGQQRAAAGPRGEAGLPGQPGAPGPAGSEGPRGHGGGASVSNGSGLPSGAGANALLYDDGTTQDWSGSPTILGLTLDSLQADTAGDIDPGVTITDAVTLQDDSNYNDTGSWMVMGGDDFPRMVYFNNGRTELRFVQCLDELCATSNETIVVTDAGSVESPTLTLGLDGFARISYVTYDTPSELHHVRCTNASCSAKVDTLVDTSIGLSSYYITGIAIGPDGFARIVYDNYDATSALRLATCNDADCTAPTLTTVVASGNYLETSSVAVGSDGFARISYVDYSGTPDELHFVQCTNAACTTKNDTEVLTATSLYFQDLALGSDGFGRIVFHDQTADLLKYVQCTDAACSTKNTTTVSAMRDGVTSVVMGDDGFARISYAGYTVDTIGYVQCTNAACSTKSTREVDNEAGYVASIAVSSDGLASIAFMDADETTLKLARMHADDGQDLVTGSSIGTSLSKFGEIFGSRIDAEQVYADQLFVDGTDFADLTPSQWTTTGTDIYFMNRVGIGTSTFTDNETSYKAVIRMASGATQEGGLMISSNQNGAAGHAFLGIQNYNTTDTDVLGTKHKTNIYSELRAGNSSYGVYPGGNIVANTDIVAANLNVINQNLFISQRGINSTSGTIINSQSYIYPYETTATNVFSAVGFYSTGQFTNAANITAMADFKASNFYIQSDGTMGTRYGLLMDFDNTGITNAYGVYQSSNTVKNYFAGTIGIGSTSPEALLEVQGIEATDAVIALDADDGDDNADTWFIRSQASDNSLSIYNHTTSVFTLSSAGNLNIAGNCSDAAGGGGCTADYAEVYEAADKSGLEAGDLLAINEDGKVIKASVDDDSIVGVYSSSPGLLIGNKTGINIGSGEGTEELLEGNEVPVALMGRVPVKYSDENGEVEPGDRLAVSLTVPGHVMRMDDSGQSVGVALDSPEGGMVTMFINMTYHVLGISQDSSGQILANTNDHNMAGFSLLNVRAVSSASNTWSIDEDGVLTVVEINAGKVNAVEICIGETCVDEQTLKDLLENQQQPATEQPVEPEPIADEIPEQTPVTPGTEETPSDPLTPEPEPLP